MDIVDTQDKVELNNTQIAIDYGNPAGTSRELNKHLPGIAAKYEVKLEEINPTGYKARPDGQTISVTALDNHAIYKGFKHRVSAGTMTVNRITIYGHAIPGISELGGAGYIISNVSGGVFVYFPLDTGGIPELHKPLLICLSQNGNANKDNKWYERTSNNPNHGPLQMVLMVKIQPIFPDLQINSVKLKVHLMKIQVILIQLMEMII